MVRLDPETIELHFALGNLFRRRGETDRAIRVHLNLAERGDLDASQREHALFELGQDYLKAGLLDRAEDAFNRLEATRYGAPALHHRLEIAQMVRDWPQAITLAERLQRDLGENRAREIAHFRCELAATALAGEALSRFEVARRELDQAAQADPGHPRPRLLRGEVAAAEGDARGGDRGLAGVERDAPAWLGLVAPAWLAAFTAVGRRDEGIDVLEAVYRSHPSIDVFAALAAARAQSRRRRGGGRVGRTGAAGGSRRCSVSRRCSRMKAALPGDERPHRGRACAAPDPGAGAPAVALRLRTLRIQGTPVLLAVPGLQSLGHLRAEAKRGTRTWLSRTPQGPDRAGPPDRFLRAPGCSWSVT